MRNRKRIRHVKNRRKQRNRGMLLSSVLIVGMGVYILFQGGTRIVEEWKQDFHEQIIESTKKSFLPALFYTEEEKQDIHGWVVEQAMQILPLGSYLSERQVEMSEVEDSGTYEMILAQQAKDENEVDQNGNLIHGDAGHAEQEAKEQVQARPQNVSIEQLHDFSYLLSHYYTVDRTTMIGPEQLNVDELLAKDMHINQQTQGPKVLIFHTHSQEAFTDSVAGDPNTSIVGMGARLSERLNEKGIPTIHHDGVYDLVNGKLDRSKAYELSEQGVRKILQENPSIEVVIDLHRDGVGANTHLVTEYDGKQAAKIMFFNGLSRTKANGEIAYLPNPYIQDNLSFSLQMQLAAESMYSGFVRRIYLKGYRYSLHMMPKSLLIEAGAQTNSVEEMQHAMDMLAEVLYAVLVGA